MSATINVPVPENLQSNVVNETSFPESRPSDAILFLAQLEKATKDITDDDAKEMCNRSLKYFRYAMKILNKKNADPSVQFLQMKYGTSLESVLNLGDDLREIDISRSANETVSKALSSVKVGDASSASIATDMAKNSIFGFT